MLSEDEKTKIKEEEYYRFLIRKELDAEKQPTTKWGLIVKFFNTSLGIFLLSTVLVGLFTWAYSEMSNSIKNDGIRKEKVDKLSLEIDNRLFFISKLGGLRSDDIIHIEIAYFGQFENKNKKPSDALLFDEFENRTLYSLLFEFEYLAQEESEKIKIYELREACSQVPNYLWQLSNFPQIEISDSTNFISIMEQMLEPVDEKDFSGLSPFYKRIFDEELKVVIDKWRLEKTLPKKNKRH